MKDKEARELIAKLEDAGRRDWESVDRRFIQLERYLNALNHRIELLAEHLGYEFVRVEEVGAHEILRPVPLKQEIKK